MDLLTKPKWSFQPDFPEWFRPIWM